MTAAHRNAIATALDRHAATAAATAQEHDAIAADLRRIALVAVFVVPLARLQTALDVDLLAFRQVLGERFGLLAPQHDAMPLGFFLALARFVVPRFRGGHVDRRDGGAPGRVAQFRVTSEIPHEDDFIHASHGADCTSSSALRGRGGWKFVEQLFRERRFGAIWIRLQYVL